MISKKMCFYSFGASEIVIGAMQCIAVLESMDPSGSLQTEQIALLFAGFLSISLGIGLLTKKPIAIKALLFFASGVAFSKILLLSGFLSLSESSRILFPKYIENIVSIAYHLSIVFFLLRITHHRLD